MSWTFTDTLGYSDSGAMVQKDEDGLWCALPFGGSGGVHGCFASRDDAVAAAEMGQTMARCCQDDDGTGP